MKRKVNSNWVDRDYGYRPVKQSFHDPWEPSLGSFGSLENYLLNTLVLLGEHHGACFWGGRKHEECWTGNPGDCRKCLIQMAEMGEPFPLDLFDSQG